MRRHVAGEMVRMPRPLPVAKPLVVENGATAKFECVYPTCGGICCRNGRPPVEHAESARIAENLEKFLPHLRPKARRVVTERGFATKRTKDGLPMLAVSEGWCVFENGGCTLHKVGAEEGDRWRYKPWRCVAFPIERPAKDDFYIRQWGVHGEAWDLFCLNPEESPRTAVDTLGPELAFAAELDGGAEAWRGVGVRPVATKRRKTTKNKAGTKRAAGN
jgi:hypothetical protein